MRPILVGCGALLFLASFWGWSRVQGDFDYQNIAGDPKHLFLGGEESYAIFRIPGLIVIPAGAGLADSSTLEDDRVLAFAEGRREGSLDEAILI